MKNDINSIIGLFVKHGGVFENLTVEYNQARGFFLNVKDNNKIATVTCPLHLLVDIGDIGISEAGLKIINPEKYGEHMEFLAPYFNYHFGSKLVEKILEEKSHIDALSEQEKKVLSLVNLPNITDDMATNLDYARIRILRSHNLLSGQVGKKVIMPVVTFMNHNKDGVPFSESEDGVSVSGKFESEAFAFYHNGDCLSILWDHLYTAESDYIFSVPMWIDFPKGKRLYIRREYSQYTSNENGFRLPVFTQDEATIKSSWFPLYYSKDVRYPIRVASQLSAQYGVSGAYILYAIFRYNLNQLLQVVFDLKNSKNPYVQTIVSGVEQQLRLIGGLS